MPQYHIDTTPYWTDSASLTRYPKLERDETVDVAILGGGITGLTAAYLLTRAGRRVALLERERCAQVDTGHTSAHLTMVTDARFSDLVKRPRSRASRVGRGTRRHRADPRDRSRRGDRLQFRLGTGIPARSDRDRGRRPYVGVSGGRVARVRLGFDASFVDAVPLIGGPGIAFGDQARVHPRKYLAVMARAITDRGGLIFEHSAADEFPDSPRSVTANGHTVTCEYVVLATHTPLMGTTGLVRATLFQTKLALYTSYVVGGRVPKSHVPDALFWDDADPYHYLRLEPHRDHDVVIFGGEDHKTGQAADTVPASVVSSGP